MQLFPQGMPCLHAFCALAALVTPRRRTRPSGPLRARAAWPSRFTNSDIEMLHQVTSRPGELYRLLTFSNEGGRNHQNTSIAELGQRNARAADDLRRIRGGYQIAASLDDRSRITVVVGAR